MKRVGTGIKLFGTACAVVLNMTYACADGAPAAAPKFLFHHVKEHSAGVIAEKSPGVTAEASAGGIDVTVAKGVSGYPGFHIHPSSGSAWDLSPWGHVEAKITNTGSAAVSVALRVDNAGDWRRNPWNTESAYLKPGETKIIRVIFGYQYGYNAGYPLKPSEVVNVLVFVSGKSDSERRFRVEDLQAAGSPGEKPPVNTGKISDEIENGIIAGAGAKLLTKTVIEAKECSAGFTPSGSVTVKFETPKKGRLTLRPGSGEWNFKNYHEVVFKVKNTGEAVSSAEVSVNSKAGSTDARKFECAPGETAEVRVSFVPEVCWKGVRSPVKGRDGTQKGTGTRFESNRGNGVTLSASGPASFEIVSITASDAPVTVPSWLGKRPPVDGDWKQTLNENFDGDSLNLKLWNIYTSNFWDKRTHFSKENAIVKDGRLILRYEQKSGWHNDDPQDKSPVAYTDYVCGFADSYGKWTQRYGYFEARMKLPRCPGLWPAFWTMPDRGGDPDPKANPQWKRASTGDGGMEFDIMEHLTGWGPYRFNIAFHWDGYGKDHMALGSSNIYVPADKDGYITIGMLWLPGSVTYYGNGKPIAVWEDERVCSVQSYPIFYMVSGGWANLPLDISQLPSDFEIDYFRAWQRADLATPEDGPKPNDGAPKSQF